MDTDITLKGASCFIGSCSGLILKKLWLAFIGKGRLKLTDFKIPVRLDLTDYEISPAQIN